MTGLIRRQVLAGIGAGVASLAAGPLRAQGLRVRRNIVTMGDDDPDLRAFSEAMGVLRRNGGLEAQRAFHANPNMHQHGSWRFLPWHRMQLAAFESIIIAITDKADFALPYWDWQEAETLPSIVFRDPNLYIDGRKADSETNIAEQRWGLRPQAADLLNGHVGLFAGTPNAAGTVETFGHNLVHTLVGGPMGSLTQAPLDPVFWLHHANIDRVWSTWHDQTAPDYPYEFLVEAFAGFWGPSGPYNPVRAADLLEAPNLGYVYDSPYPFRLFNVDPGLTKTGFTRKVARTQRYRPEPAGLGTAAAKLTLPDALLADLRADRDGLLDITGEGVVRMALPNLKDKVVRMIASAPGGAAGGGTAPGEIVLFAAPAFFHEMAGMDHTDHAAHPDDWAFEFHFGDELINLIGLSKGPVELRIDTVTVDGKPAAALPIVRDVGLILTVKRHEWVADEAK